MGSIIRGVGVGSILNAEKQKIRFSGPFSSAENPNFRVTSGCFVLAFHCFNGIEKVKLNSDLFFETVFRPIF